MLEFVKKKFQSNFFNGYIVTSALRLALLLVLSVSLMNYINFNNDKFFGFFLLFYFIFQLLEILFLIKTNNS